MITGFKKNIEKIVKQWLEEAGVLAPTVVLERSATAQFGEYSTNVAMRYAKELGKNPLVIAEELATFLRANAIAEIERIEPIKPGFVNFYLSPALKIDHVNTINNLGENFGKNTLLQGEKWVIEHTSPNPNKAMHLGHLRNNLIGMGIIRLLELSGAQVTSDAVYNNRGIAIAKVMYGYLAHMKKSANIPTDIAFWAENQQDWFTPTEKGIKPDVFVTECYVLGENDFKANSEIEQTVRQMVVDWESGDEIIWKLWEIILNYAYVGINRTLNRLDSHWDKIWYEHEHYQKGKDYVERGLDNDVFVELVDGAILTNIEADYGLPETILLKNDGTSLYITQDIALTDLKKQTFKADKLVWVIGPEQSLAMKQLFAVCEQLGIGKITDFTHVSYGYVGLRDQTGAFKKISSRTGNVVLIDDVIDSVKETIKQRLHADAKYDEVKEGEIAERLAIGAVKFAFLKSERTQEMSFDVEQSVDTQGDSGMYVLYTYVRTQSILRKVGAISVDQINTVTVIEVEAELLRILLYFEEVVKKSVSDLSVHHIAQYLLELCSQFNSWYAKEVILDGGERQAYKLAIVHATAVVISNGLSILGIKTVDEI